MTVDVLALTMTVDVLVVIGRGALLSRGASVLVGVQVAGPWSHGNASLLVFRFKLDRDCRTSSKGLRVYVVGFRLHGVANNPHADLMQAILMRTSSSCKRDCRTHVARMHLPLAPLRAHVALRVEG